MKATLTYSLPDDYKDLFAAITANTLAMALWDTSQYLRDVDKYETGHTIEQIREKFRSILDEYDINLDNLTE